MESYEHEELKKSLYHIGNAIGIFKNALIEPDVNRLRSSKRQLSGLRKRLDVAWEMGRDQWIPIEIHHKGDLAQALFRLELVHQWSYKLIVVAEKKQHDSIRTQVDEAFSNYKDKLILLTPEEIKEAANNVASLANLRRKIFGDVTV